MSQGLLSFPLTFFDAESRFNEAGYRAHVAEQGRAGAVALFAAGGTGEFFSLGLEEYKRVVRAAAEEVPDTVPLLAGVGYGHRDGNRIRARGRSEWSEWSARAAAVSR